MKKIYLIIFSFSAFLLTATAQNEFVVDGGSVMVQNGGEVFIQGELFNQNSGAFTGTITNNGLIELSANDTISSQYVNNAVYTYSTNAAHQRMFRFKAPSVVAAVNRTQNASGNLNFYNVEIQNNRNTPAAQTAGSWIPVGGGVVINDDMTIHGTLDFQDLNSKIYANGNEVYVVDTSTAAIANYTDTKYIQFDGTANGGTLRRGVAAGRTYGFPIGTFDEGYVGMTINFDSAPSNESVSATFTDLPDIGIVSPVFRQYTISTYCPLGPQWVEVAAMVPYFGFWQIDAVDDPNWSYDMVINSLTSRASTTLDADLFSRYLDKDTTTGNPFTFYKLIRTSDASVINSSFNWYSDIPTSGEMCAIGPDIPGLEAHNISGFSQFGVGGNSSVGLPIELLYLRADDIDNEFIKVDWASAVEINNMGFELERRTENSSFEKIAWIDGAGTTAEEQYYSYDDYDVVPNTLYYYRLKQIDFDGNSEYSYIVTAMIIDGKIFTISDFIPNPAHENSSLIVNTSVDKELFITIYNTLGQIITNKEVQVAPGSNKIDFEFDRLADGTYHAIIRTGNEVFNKKLIITKY